MAGSLARAERVRREGIKLIVLIAVAVVMFVTTRAAADYSRVLALRDAAVWHQRGGQALAGGDLATAADAFRRATLKDRGNTRYALDLAAALARQDDRDAAQRILLRLREAAPEDPQINLQLARLAAGAGDVTNAVRYYRSALYAPWTNADEPRRIRLELIRFLLARGDRQRAAAELVAARTTVTDSVAAHTELGSLLAASGDPRLARDEFDRALRLDPLSTEALAGAGTAAFATGDYAAARRYLSASAALPPDATAIRDIADLVVTRDPLETRLGAAERRRRLIADIADVRMRLMMCGAAAPDDQWPPVPSRLDQDDIEDALAALGRFEQVIAARCAPDTPFDRALRIIAQRHGAAD